MNENVVDKLRIQIYQATGGNQFNLIYKKDLPLNSIVSREDFIITSNQIVNSHNTNAYDQNDQGSDYGQYSSFAHGNSLNDMMSQSANSLKQHRLGDRKKITSKHLNLTLVS